LRMRVLPCCPRCGYDLSGQVTRWNHEDSAACPLAGVCTECGDDDWREVYTGKWSRVPGFVEHSRWWRTPLAALRTLGWVLMPWVFWRRVRRTDRVRLVPLLAWMPLIVAVAYVLDGVLQSIITVAYRFKDEPGLWS
jgi:hypothetical protein